VLIAALTLFITSGISHFAQDVYEVAFSDDSHHVDDCETNGDQCPPACPDCHCSRSGYPAPVQFDARLVERVLAEDVITLWDPVTDPPSPDLDALFRPPRV
jgi:hypothetical protein